MILAAHIIFVLSILVYAAAQILDLINADLGGDTLRIAIEELLFLMARILVGVFFVPASAIVIMFSWYYVKKGCGKEEKRF